MRSIPLVVLVVLVAAGPGRAQLNDPDLTQARDADLDGLPDAVERFFGTDPDRSDTDGDGLGDYVELTAPIPTNPLAPDTDKDGICDGPLDVGGWCVAAANAPVDESAGGGCSPPNERYDWESGTGVSGTHVLGCAAQPPRPPWLLLGLLLGTRTWTRQRRQRRTTALNPSAPQRQGATHGGDTTRTAPSEAA